MALQLTVAEQAPIVLGVGGEPELELVAEPVVFVSLADYYDGPYEFTPEETAQTINIEGLAAREDIVINPIPYNYGLITWNGSILTVS